MKEHIIDQAMKLFMQSGFKAIRMDDIATHLGISKRTLYEIFGDKETLIKECMSTYRQGLEKNRSSMASQASNIIEEFVFLFQDWENIVDENHKLMMSLQRFYPHVYQEVIEAHKDEGYKSLKEKIKKGVEEGYLLENINYDLAISVFTYSIFGIISNQKAILPNNVSEKDAFKYVVTYFFRGISTEKGRKLIDEYIDKKII